MSKVYSSLKFGAYHILGSRNYRRAALIKRLLSADWRRLELATTALTMNIEKTRQSKKIDEFKLRLKEIQAANPHPELIDEHIEAIISFVKPYTLTERSRLYALCQAVRYVVRSGIEGSIVECGVWRGGSMMAVAQTLQILQQCDKHLFLFDTFSGMTEPTSVDIERHSGLTGAELIGTKENPGPYTMKVSLGEVKRNMALCRYPSNQVHYIEGPVERTLIGVDLQKISVLRIDTDWYESTKCELEYLYPKLSVGGVLIIDDYGHFEGSRKATDEYFETLSKPPLLNRIDYTARLAIKVA